ncbi:MAG: metal-dependent transcriptional regulator [Planctomycetota bacterium]|jgi:DtxR family Mn-dependent transcriptional regulator
MISPHIEEVLEALYVCEFERGQYLDESVSADTLTDAAEAGLVRRDADKYHLTPAGQAAGRNVVRRHRLAECMLKNVLAAGGDHLEEDACSFEHVLREELDEKICTLLGHPTQCPHGLPIPQGECCRKAQEEGVREVAPLSDGKVGIEGTVAYLATRDNREVQKLMAMGVLPGSSIQLIRRFPSYVFQVGYSQFTVDRSLAELIYVHWPTNDADNAAASS